MYDDKIRKSHSGELSGYAGVWVCFPFFFFFLDLGEVAVKAGNNPYNSW